eukprot:CAMPEP_0197519144 /NCGR_PEP_ID=MMETSP1318-20131121/4412_1 /TAXON_ID=552666 /ORGANISM="Partenskyella glossopodia, Strain RCC365" /LENGTH=269 /DNA_ID=CAMNT_0043069959 /DNA_START=21 /DNA_END=830 /DNA_ORIENTATION=-
MPQPKQAQIVRYKASKKETFELMLQPGGAKLYSEGKKSVESVLFVDAIFRNAKKAKMATAKELEAAFGTSDVVAVAKRILDKGSAQLSSSDRKSMMDRKQKQVVEFVRSNYIDSRTKLPLPVARVTLAMSGFRLDAKGEVAAEARRFVEYAQRKGSLALRRKEIVHTVAVPIGYKSAATKLFSNHGVSIISSKASANDITFEIGCLSGELEAVLVGVSRLTSEDDGKSTGKSKRRSGKNSRQASVKSASKPKSTGDTKSRSKKGRRNKR